MKRSTTKGLAPETPVSVARNGRRRVTGRVIRTFEHAVRGTIVEYRADHNGGTYTAQLADVRVERDLAKRLRAAKASSGKRGSNGPA